MIAIARFLALPVAAAFLVGAAFGEAASAVPERESPYRNLAVFGRVLSHIDAAWVDEPDHDELLYGAIRGLASSLDPHTEFLDPDEYRLLTSDTEGRFGGIGAQIEVDDGWLTIVTVFEGAPAARVGLRPGDKFLSIAGRDARDMRLGDAVRLMRGEPGTAVDARVRRPGREDAVRVTLVREIIDVEAVEARLLDDGVVYLKISIFQATTTAELRDALDRAAIEAAPRGGLRGVLLDLRNNGGGLLDEAIAVADEFLSEGVIVSVRGRDGAVLSESHATRSGTRPAWPVAVLVNEYSASASEIVAAALRDHDRAVLVGARTFGKGSVQNVIELEDGSALKLTIARYYTPSGRSIQAAGIEPDVLVEGNLVRRGDGVALRERDLEHHLRGDAEPEPPTPPAAGAARGDPRGAPSSATPTDPFADDLQARVALQTLQALLRDRQARAR